MTNKQRLGVLSFAGGLTFALVAMSWPVRVSGAVGGDLPFDCGSAWGYVVRGNYISLPSCLDKWRAMYFLAVVLVGLSLIGLSMVLFGRKRGSAAD